MHHIIPKHMSSFVFSPVFPKTILSGFINDKRNLVVLPLPRHLDAHALLYIAFGSSGDYSAISLICARELKKRQRTSKCKAVGKALGLRYGPANGLLFGKQAGLSNQSTAIKNLLGFKIDWFYCDGTEYESTPSESVVSLMQVNAVKGYIRDYVNFNKVLHGKVPSAYGGRILKVHNAGFY